MSTTLAPATTATALTLSPTKAIVVRWIGYAALLGALVMIIGGGTVWGIVTSQLKAENITVSEDADFMPGAAVQGPFSAYAQATIINHHALEMSDGKTYAELEQDDPTRATVMNASFLRASLFTSVVSYGVSALVIGVGLLFGLFGWAIISAVPASKKNKA
ncbi:hypothetical protein B0I08_104265 [Glaciihabitans tibetensis]|uniref:Aromatic ring-opening dioxygenase LigA n=1 Tax=Glaciihabitans tibetensis TaxID=1266600 RepID=A0A2T0VEM0_9MICO|nr:aromatic ring-opening dioxygenase LigA [Glaciihabitans tibetensis]PRY68562.1 hypothetical protein B0I08_104265 [Glaciihabitans tibetensis]